MRKYYQVTHAARPVEIPGGKVQFEATEYFPASNSHWGTYSTEDENIMAALDLLVAKGRVYAITEHEYEQGELKKKTLGSSPSLIGSQNWHAPQMGARQVVGVAPVAVEGPLESVDEAISVRMPTKVMKNVTPPKPAKT